MYFFGYIKSGFLYHILNLKCFLVVADLTIYRNNILQKVTKSANKL